ncbi:hypothetical protein BDA99DRAFT_536348 [Phascolomyces articulosus]|uniref:Uncharacterized protein n=1 Tax=Phascolomyces articulosus TaxID=60185 RepID=A0AAD5KB87_9FUNG|nr:hypothetical protein BDA99DRAFT_536348 [Phascolomyces articulosus]
MTVKIAHAPLLNLPTMTILHIVYFLALKKGHYIAVHATERVFGKIYFIAGIVLIAISTSVEALDRLTTLKSTRRLLSKSTSVFNNITKEPIDNSESYIKNTRSDPTT